LHKKTYPGGSQDTFNLIWLPYYLDPDAPREGIPLTECFISKYGPERAASRQQRLIDIGLVEGISFSFGCKIGNTRDAHRLIELAKSRYITMQTIIMDRLFEAYFEQNGDITDRAMLREIGVAAGLEAKVVKDWLESDQGGEEVDKQAKAAREGSGSGVPCHVIQGMYNIDGADDPAAFSEDFHKVKSKEDGT